MQTRTIWLAFGANIGGLWGDPLETFARAAVELRINGWSVDCTSSIYTTPPLGQVRQPVFFNAVAGVWGSGSPAALLRLLKRIERQAGRRANGHWGPRPLDIDILDFGGRVIGPQGGHTARGFGRLVLPHPEMTRRGFVLVPLAEVAQGWRHPVLGVGARTLVRRSPGLARGIRKLGPWPQPPA
jgi:2-amino-4-hydroxy-6-hydroxymethyldihydropteridine diphosphokinase